MRNKRFKVLEKSGNPLGAAGMQLVLQDITTGVHYLFIQSGYAGGLTVLVDAEGRPVVSPVATQTSEMI